MPTTTTTSCRSCNAHHHPQRKQKTHKATDGALCDRLWAARLASLSRDACCADNFGAEGCRLYPAACWAPPPGGEAYEGERTCALQPLGFRRCGEQIEAGAAFESEADCCARAHGGACVVHPAPCWLKNDLGGCEFEAQAARCKGFGARGRAWASRAECECRGLGRCGSGGGGSG